MDDGTWVFLTTLERLDTEPPTPTPPEAILHKNLSSSFDLFSLGSETGPGGLLFEEARFQRGEAKLLSSLRSIPWQISRRCLTQRFFFFLFLFSQHKARTLPMTLGAPARLYKSNASQGNLIETLCDLWAQRIGREPGSQPTRRLMGGSSSAWAGSICQLPLPD